MNSKKVTKHLTKADKIEKTRNGILLFCTLLSLGILLVELVYKKLTPNTEKYLDIIFAVLWIFLMAEHVMRIQKKTKSERIEYLKFNKGEIAYGILSLVIVPFSFFNLSIRVFRWITLLKVPNVIRRFNDEIVFQIIAKTIAIILILFFLVPFLNVIGVSFSSPGYIVNILPKEFNLFSINYVLHDKGFLRSFGNSFFITIVGTVISVLSMAMAAYPLSKPDMPLRKTMMMFFMIVMLFSGGIAPNILLVNALGLTDTIWALIFPSVVIVYYLLLLKGFYESIPVELEESAKLDGATNFQILWNIIMPIASPMIATVSFFTIITYWNNINNSILYITSNQKIYPVPMFIKNFLSRDPMDVAQSMPELLPYWDNIKMSYILVSIVPIICAYPFIFKYLKNDVSAGAVKG